MCSMTGQVVGFKDIAGIQNGFSTVTSNVEKLLQQISEVQNDTLILTSSHDKLTGNYRYDMTLPKPIHEQSSNTDTRQL